MLQILQENVLQTAKKKKKAWKKLQLVLNTMPKQNRSGLKPKAECDTVAKTRKSIFENCSQQTT